MFSTAILLVDLENKQDVLPELKKKMVIKRFLLFVSGLCALHNLSAQLCQGSLGDPVVNITFGSGAATTGPALSSSITSYEYVSGICPNDGFYTIAGSTSNCFGNTWLTLSEDHTPGDNNGYMMLVNASFDPRIFYIQEVSGLCGGTTYEFAAWLVNVIVPSACNGNTEKPNITFNIETKGGQVLQTYSTGNIEASSTPSWKQYGLFFTTPSGTSSVILKITNNAPGGCGNDLALDDITFRPCGPKVSIDVNGITGTREVCTGDTTSFNFSSNLTGGYANSFFQWQKSTDSISWTDIPGANGRNYAIPPIVTPGKYFYRLAVADGSNISISSCRIASQAVLVHVNALPVPAASNSGPVCEGGILTLTASAGATYRWSGPAGFISHVQSPSITDISVNNSGKYYVAVTSQAGCVNEDSTAVMINVNPVANAGSNTEICRGAETQLQGSANGAISIRWSPPAGLSDPLSLTPTASPGATTQYTLTVSNGACKDSATVLVSVLETPAANAGPDRIIIGNQGVTLQGSITGSNVTYFWTPNIYMSSDTVLTPLVNPPFDTTYTLHAMSNIGCGTVTDEVAVRYFKDIYVPNAFTPNNDGLNDRWFIPPLASFPSSEVSVYNRYGQLIFHSSGNMKGWDGTFKGMPQPSGVYAYVIDLKNGLNKLRGVVMLLR